MRIHQIRPVLALFAAVLSITISHAAQASGRLLTIRVPKDYPTIQQAIDSSFDGDTILVSPGTYTESLKLGTIVGQCFHL